MTESAGSLENPNLALIDILSSQNQHYRGFLLMRVPLKDGRETVF